MRRPGPSRYSSLREHSDVIRFYSTLSNTKYPNSSTLQLSLNSNNPFIPIFPYYAHHGAS